MRNYFIALLLVMPLLTQAQQKNSIFKVDDSYLLKHDIVYKTPAYEGFEGFPLGNGDRDAVSC